MEPRDLQFEEMSFVLNDPHGNAPSGHDSEPGPWPWSERINAVHALFADGSLHVLPIGTPPETIRGLLTTDDNPK